MRVRLVAGRRGRQSRKFAAELRDGVAVDLRLPLLEGRGGVEHGGVIRVHALGRDGPDDADGGAKFRDGAGGEGDA